MNALAQSTSLLQHPNLWRGDQHLTTVSSVPTGFNNLDAALPGGGWPIGALTELLIKHEGMGELSIFMPALARLSQAQRWIAWIAPPYIPYAPALAAQNIDLTYVLWIKTETNKDSLWCAEQALRSGACGAVLSWPCEVDDRSLRRLQLAAEAGKSCAIVFRAMRHAQQISPAALRLCLEHTAGQPIVRILKRRGSALTTPIRLERMPTAMPSSHLTHIAA